uniref:Resistance to inhibitors of cholinesterase protein 3 N-terminal domain-containing protein n=1 Tax=Periophthalmus magnuspinnatus TaxID=409849 RepID=A0A3B4B704_9GOBI
MSITTCQKVTLISCSVLCVSLFLPRMLLPRAKEDTVQKEGKVCSSCCQMHHWGLSLGGHTLSDATTVARLRGIGRKTNLMTQVIPIYGFGILLYIVYIIYKVQQRCDVQNEDYELVKLQRRLLQTEQMMEMIVSGKSRGSKREEKLLRHLRQITELMQEGRLEGTSPEMEAEEVPYFAGWEGYPEETYPQYEEEPWNRKRCKIAPLVVTLSQPTAEALAERMEQEEEDLEDACEEDKGGQEEEEEAEEEEEEESETEEEVPAVREEPDEEDPVMEAESLQFSCDVGTNPEREAEEETGGALTEAGEDFVPPQGPVPEQQSKHRTNSGLRMRNRRDT